MAEQQQQRGNSSDTLFQQTLDRSLTPTRPEEPPKAENWTQIHSPFSDFDTVSLEDKGIHIRNVLRNPSVAILYEEGLRHETGTNITSTGALVCRSGRLTGRSPENKRIVEEETSQENVWWGPVNIPLSEKSFMINRERAIDYLNTRERLYVIDGYAGWVEKYRLKVRVICARAYHALFMKNMLIRPTPEQLAEFGEPDFVIYNAGQFPANRYTKGMTSSTSVAINFKRMEAVILGTEYAGEMKKGIFTVMHYIMPLRGVLSLHSSCNEGLPSSNNNEEEEGRNGDVSLFFGLSGTGKTTLSADPRRKLIGDDEHVWYEDGIFNIEGGCYAKAIGLDPAQEPEIFQAVRFGAVLENVVFDERTREVDYNDASITENTRTAYPIEFIPNAKIPCLSVGHPRNIIMLCCDAFGVLPPVSRLTPEQASYYFISGYTAKVAGTEQGITEPQVAFSPGFGAAFLVWHPAKYAEMLAERVKRHGTYCWLVSTGWTAGGYGVGYRIKLRHTRAIIDGIHSGELASAEYETLPYFNLQIPKSCSNVPPELLHPRKMWQDKEAYDRTLNNLAKKFVSNFAKYADLTAPEISAVGPTPE